MRFIRLALFMIVCLSAAAPAGDDIQAISGLWNGFVQALDRGDYRRAHNFFSQESKQALPFADFVLEYSPVSVARELVLAKPENLSTSLDGDWAELTYGGYRQGTGRPFAVAVSMVKNGDAWGLVAARNEQRERLEAGARMLLRMAASVRGLPNARQLMGDLLARESADPALSVYRFDTDGDILKAMPSVQGLRGFHVDPAGAVRPGLQPAPEPKAPPPVPEPKPPEPPAPIMVDGLPEIGEPPQLPPGLGVGEVLPEMLPPPPVFSGNAYMERLPDPEEFSLPDRIE